MSPQQILEKVIVQGAKDNLEYDQAMCALSILLRQSAKLRRLQLAFTEIQGVCYEVQNSTSHTDHANKTLVEDVENTPTSYARPLTKAQPKELLRRARAARGAQ